MEAKKDPRTSNERLYNLAANKVVTITGEEMINGQAWVKIISDDPAVNEAYVVKENVEYVKH